MSCHKVSVLCEKISKDALIGVTPSTLFLPPSSFFLPSTPQSIIRGISGLANKPCKQAPIQWKRYLRII